MKQLFILAISAGILLTVPSELAFVLVLPLHFVIGFLYAKGELSEPQSTVFLAAWCVFFAITWASIGRGFFASPELAIINVGLAFGLSRAKRKKYTVMIVLALVAETFLMRHYPQYAFFNLVSMLAFVAGMWVPKKEETETA